MTNIGDRPGSRILLRKDRSGTVFVNDVSPDEPVKVYVRWMIIFTSDEKIILQNQNAPFHVTLASLRQLHMSDEPHFVYSKVQAGSHGVVSGEVLMTLGRGVVDRSISKL